MQNRWERGNCVGRVGGGINMLELFKRCEEGRGRHREWSRRFALGARM